MCELTAALKSGESQIVSTIQIHATLEGEYPAGEGRRRAVKNLAWLVWSVWKLC